MMHKINPVFYNISSKLDITNSSFTYGEVYSDSVINTISNLYNEDILFEDYYFIDIGCGCGKLLVDITNTLNINSCGIEIEPTRFEECKLQIENYKMDSKIELYNDNFKNIYFGNYDVLYCCNFVFSKEDNLMLYKKIINEFTGYVILFDYNHILKPFYISEHIVKTSWSPNVKIFVFKL
jgi:ubiquinone/menaquinone biosynthesis C-methylase UbiE